MVVKDAKPPLARSVASKGAPSSSEATWEPPMRRSGQSMSALGDRAANGNGAAAGAPSQSDNASAAAVSQSKRSRDEITKRVEEALSQYENMEDIEPERFAGVRRDHEVDSSFADLAEAGRMRIEVVLVALSEISGEREHLLNCIHWITPQA